MEFTLQEMSKVMNISKATLRYYDKIGLVTSKRKDNNYRYYDYNDLEVIQYILVLKYAKFTIKEIKLTLSIIKDKNDNHNNQTKREVINNKINELSEVIKNYQNIVKLLKEFNDIIAIDKCDDKSQERIAKIVSNVLK